MTGRAGQWQKKGTPWRYRAARDTGEQSLSFPAGLLVVYVRPAGLADVDEQQTDVFQ